MPLSRRPKLALTHCPLPFPLSILPLTPNTEHLTLDIENLCACACMCVCVCNYTHVRIFVFFEKRGVDSASVDPFRPRLSIAITSIGQQARWGYGSWGPHCATVKEKTIVASRSILLRYHKREKVGKRDGRAACARTSS